MKRKQRDARIKRAVGRQRLLLIEAACLSVAGFYCTAADGYTFVSTYGTSATPSQPIYSSYGNGIVELNESGSVTTQSWVNQAFTNSGSGVAGAVGTNYGITFDGSGNLYDSGNYGTPGNIYAFPGATPSNSPTIINGSINQNVGVAYSPTTRNLYVAGLGGTISEITTSGALVTSVTVSQSSPNLFGITVDGSGNVYVSNAVSGDIIKLGPNLTGQNDTWATGFSAPHGIAFNSLGTLYAANNTSNVVSEVGAGSGSLANPTGGAATQFASFANVGGLQGIAVDSSNDVFISDVLPVSNDFAIQQVSNGTTALVGSPETLIDSGGTVSGVSNYRFFTFVPEPATPILVGLSAMGILLRRRGRGRSA